MAISSFKPPSLDHLRQCLDLPRLSREEERALLHRAQHGDTGAEERLMRHNVALAVWFTVHMRHRCYSSADFKDCVAEALCGIHHAIHTWKADRNARLATYAKDWMRHHIMRNILEKRTLIRFSSGTTQLTFKLSRLDKKGECRDARSVSELLGCSMNVAHDILLAKSEQCSLDARETCRYGDGAESQGDHTLPLHEVLPGDVLDPEAALLRKEIEQHATLLLKSILARLPPREREILVLHLDTDDTPTPPSTKDIAAALGLTHDTVRNVKAVAVGKLKVLVSKLCPEEREILASML